MPEISQFVFIAASYQVHAISRTKEMFFQAGVFRMRRNFLVFRLARNRCFVSAPFDAGLNVMLHTVISSSSRRRLARSSTRQVLSYHGLMESSMSSTTGQPRHRRYIRVSQQRKTKLRWPENSIEHQNVHRRRSRSSSSASPISTNPRSMEEECEYGLPSGTCFTARRLEVVAVAGLLWICLLYTSPSPRD